MCLALERRNEILEEAEGLVEEDEDDSEEEEEEELEDE